MYERGRGVPLDYAEALRWYRRAAMQGDTNGQANLAWMYEMGFGTLPDFHQAEYWYRRAANGGNARAQYNLGRLYHNGRGIEQDEEESQKWFRRAAESGYTHRWRRIGVEGAASERPHFGNALSEFLFFFGRSICVTMLPWHRRPMPEPLEDEVMRDSIHLDRRALLKSAAATAALSGFGTFLNVSAFAQGMTKIDMQLGWLVSNGLLGEIVADNKGYYKEQGIEFSITPGGPNVDGVASVAAGRSQVGQLSSSPSLMLARSAGIPVKAIAAGYQKHPFTYFSLSDAPIKTPQDMIGKTIATQPTAFILARALLAKNGISEDEVELVNMGSDMNQLMTGQVQAVTGWQTNINALKVLGDKRVDMMLWDTGIQLYANVYYTTDQMLAENAEALAGFLRASALGWGYAKEHPEEAVDIFVNAYPNMDKASEMEAAPLVLGFSFDEKTKENGWGQMTKDNWQAQIDIYAQLDQFQGDVPTVDDVMTLEILDMTEKTRKEVG